MSCEWLWPTSQLVAMHLKLQGIDIRSNNCGLDAELWVCTCTTFNECASLLSMGVPFMSKVSSYDNRITLHLYKRHIHQ